MTKIYLVGPDSVFTVAVDADPDPSQPFPYDGRRQAPPPTGPRQAARSLGHDPDSDWEVVPDWRGVEYWLADGKRFVIDQVGVAPPAAALLERPLILLKNDKGNELSTACRAQIVSGFTSAALGQPHLYPSNPTDQLNLTASVVAALAHQADAGWVTRFWCALDGVWDFRPHSAGQIIKVGEDAKAAFEAAQAKNAGLQALLATASSPAEVADLTWGEA